MKESISIYEPLYEPGQVLLNGAFIPYPVIDRRNTEWREVVILVEMYRSGCHLRSAYTGLFSPKFPVKSHMTGETFIEFVRGQESADVYFINPFPQIRYWSYNVWMQGEYAHPGICEVAQNLVDACGIRLSIPDAPRHGPGVLAYSNFWVGSQEFWEQYVGGVLVPIAEFLEWFPHKRVSQDVMAKTSHTDSAPFLPFVVERLFSTFIAERPYIRSVAYKHSHDEVHTLCLNEYEKILFRRMKADVDMADCQGWFCHEIIERLDAACELWQQHSNDFYSVRPHPHTRKLAGLAGGRCD